MGRKTYDKCSDTNLAIENWWCLESGEEYCPVSMPHDSFLLIIMPQNEILKNYGEWYIWWISALFVPDSLLVQCEGHWHNSSSPPCITIVTVTPHNPVHCPLFSPLCSGPVCSWVRAERIGKTRRQLCSALRCGTYCFFVEFSFKLKNSWKTSWSSC